MPVKRSIAVIGGGWAGCAAAVELAAKGCQVTLFEASRTLGGRARQVELHGRRVDNGQHILLGAYRETLRVMRMTGVDPAAAFLRLPMQMRYAPGTDGMDFKAPRLPAPFHLLFALLRAKGLSFQDKLALARFSTTARWMDWQLHADCTVQELLERYDQTARLTQLMWRPLCIAALNTPPERASAQVFLNVLRDSLGARRSDSDMLLPRMDLSALFARPAADFVARSGGEILLGTAVRRLLQDNGQWRVEWNGRNALFDAVVVATSPIRAAELLEGFCDAPLLSAFGWEPITTCYLQYPATLQLPEAFHALTEDGAAEEWGQFVFDRGRLDPEQAGLLAVVVSASSEAIATGHTALGKAIAAQLAKAFNRPELQQPQWSGVITEKRATFSCTPALERPANDTGLPGLVLAGDYTAGDYPATLEGAVRSGIAAAALC